MTTDPSGAPRFVPEPAGTDATPLAGTGGAEIRTVPADINWDDRFGVGADSTVYAVAVDPIYGTVYVGGEFSHVGGVAASYVAKWDGKRWSALGSGLDGVVRSLTVDGVGNLYAGGSFGTAGGVTAHDVAKWNGTSWSALGSGTNGTVTALAVDPGGILYAGGIFTNAGGTSANFIARWDGVSWSALGTGTDSIVWGIAADANGNVFAGGGFTMAGGAGASHVARWNGTAWSPLGTGMNFDVASLALDGNGNLYAGGGFTTAGGASANHVAKWNGTSWSALGAGTNGVVFSVATAPGRVYIGGDFTTAGAQSVLGYSEWDGSTWRASPPVGVVRAVANDDNGGVICGNLTGGGIHRISRPFGSDIKTALGAVPNATVFCLALDGSGGFFVGGGFQVCGDVVAARIAKWDGSRWLALGAGLNAPPHALALDADGNLFAAGDFTTAGGVPANHIAKWNGATWSTLGSGLGGSVEALTFDGDGNLYVGGGFATAGGAPASNVAKWDGTNWSPLGAGTDGIVYAFALDGADLYVGGSQITLAGGVPASNVAKWDGTNWSSLGAGTDNAVHALVAQGGIVYAGGLFGVAGGVNTFRVAKWDGTIWSALGPGPSLGFVGALTMDAGGNLYAGGTSSGSSAVRKWDGATWSDPGSGVPGGGPVLVNDLTTDSSSNLYVGGLFPTAGGHSSQNVAIWHTTNPTITASAVIGGTITPSGTIVVPRGGNRTFTMGAIGGFRLARVIIDGQPVGALTTYTFTDVQADHTIVVDVDPDQCLLPGTGIVGWWPGEGDAQDLIGGHPGTLENGATTAAGKVGQAFSFDGIDDDVSGIGDLSTFQFIQNTGVFTIEAWVQLDDPNAASQQAIVANTTTSIEKGFFFIWENTSGQHCLRLGLSKGVDGDLVIDSSSPGPIITDTGWHYVAAVGSGTAVWFIVDGVWYPGSGSMGALSSGSSSRVLDIGRCPYTTPLCHWDGKIDEVVIYDHLRTPDEVAATYQAGSKGMCKTTVDVEAGRPSRFTLSAARPNPSPRVVGLDLVLPMRVAVTAEVLNVAGRLVRTLLPNATLEAGPHRLSWDGRDAAGRRVAHGVYFVRVAAGSNSAVQRVVIAE